MSLPVLEMPLSSIVLPSGQKVQIRPFTVKEEKLLLMVNDAKQAKEVNDVLRQIISNCTNGKIDSYKLPLVDMEYIFVNLRKLSVGETIDHIYTCPSCKMKFESTLDLNKMAVHNQKKDNVVKIDDQIAFEMRLPSQTDENNYTEEDIQSRIMNYMVDCVEKIFVGEETHEAKNLTREEVSNFIDSLPGKSLEELIKFFLELPYCYIEDEIKCPKCNKKKKIRLEGMASFFVT